MKALVVKRDRWTVLAVCHGDDCPVLKGLECTGGSEDVDRRKMLHRLDAVALQGPPRNIQLGHPLWDGVYELKAQGGRLRLFYFLDEGRVVVCNHLADKPKEKRLKVEVQKVLDTRERYRKAKAQGRLEIVEEL